jgi:hypothetical protein
MIFSNPIIASSFLSATPSPQVEDTHQSGDSRLVSGCGLKSTSRDKLPAGNKALQRWSLSSLSSNVSILSDSTKSRSFGRDFFLGSCLTRRRGQRASTLAGQLSRVTTHQARRAWCGIEIRGLTAAGARRGSRRRGQDAGRSAVRRLRITGHHAIGRSGRNGSLKSRSGINDIRSGLCQGRIGRSGRRRCKNDHERPHRHPRRCCAEYHGTYWRCAMLHGEVAMRQSLDHPAQAADRVAPSPYHARCKV